MKISSLRNVWATAGLILVLALAGCGYQLQGVGSPAVSTVLGEGKTLLISDVEQATMYPWAAPMIRSLMRDEVHLRQIGIMVDSGPADYTLHIRVPSFQIRAYVSDDEDQTLLNYAGGTLNMEIRRWDDGMIVWQSGDLSYSERYEDAVEESAVREVLTQLIRRVLDNLQQSF